MGKGSIVERIGKLSEFNKTVFLNYISNLERKFVESSVKQYRSTIINFVESKGSANIDTTTINDIEQFLGRAKSQEGYKSKFEHIKIFAVFLKIIISLNSVFPNWKYTYQM